MSWSTGFLSLSSLFTFYFLLFLTSISIAHTILPVSNFFESPLEGRYDLTLYNSGKTYPGWLEVQHSGTKTLVGRYVGPGGSARPISRVNFTDGIVSFSIPPQWDTASNDLQFHATFQGDSLVGTIIEPNGTEYSFVGVRAPSLWRKSEPVWGTQIKLFDGKDLKGWHTVREKSVGGRKRHSEKSG